MSAQTTDGGKQEEVDPLVETLFNPKSDLHSDVPHLQYIAAIESEKVVQQIITKLRGDHSDDFVIFGFKRLAKLIRECKDRRLLFKLIRKELTFNQFATRVYGLSLNVTYKCLDDMIQSGIQPKYFQSAKSDQMESQLMAIHGKRRVEDIDPVSITDQCGMTALRRDQVMDDPVLLKMTPQAVQKIYIENKRAHNWKCNSRCIKSYYTLIDGSFLQKMEARVTDSQTYGGPPNRQKFLKSSTFRFDDPEKMQ